MKVRKLFPLIRANVQALLNGYVQASAIMDEIDGYIVPPALGGRAGVLGAIALAAQAIQSQKRRIVQQDLRGFGP
jgi:fructokinase